jgi:hypothetical protein
MFSPAGFSFAVLMTLAPCLRVGPQDPAPFGAKDSVFRLEGEELVLGVHEGPGTLTLFDLARQVGVLEGFSIYLPERADEDALRKEQVRLLRELRIPKARARELLECLLRQHNFGVIEQGEPPLRTVRLVRLQGEGLQALKSSLRFVPAAELERYRSRPGSLIVTTLSLEHLNAQAATQMLSRFFSNAALEGFASLSDESSPPALMIVGFGPTLCAIRDLVQSLDVPSRGDVTAEELQFDVELWEVEDAALRTDLAALSDPEETARRLRASSPEQSPFSLRASLVTGRAMSVPAPAPAPAADGTRQGGSFEIAARRHDAERYQVDVVWLGAAPPAKDGEADSARPMRVASSMLLKSGELRALTLTAGSSRTVVVLLRVRR